MEKAKWIKHTLIFKKPGGTSRGVLHQKPAWFILLEDSSAAVGIGECGMLPGLSWDDKPEFESVLDQVVVAINTKAPIPDLTEWPAIRFGLEMARRDLQMGGNQTLFPSEFTRGEKGIDINGLVWMGAAEDMQKQIEEKLAAGFSCIKLKIGAIDFEEELNLLSKIRSRYAPEDITIRVDANGAFSPSEALAKLERLSRLKIHSIEQPIKAGQWEKMAQLCRETPLPIALDEELIGANKGADREAIIAAIKPQAIILKPSFVGGYEACRHWIELANGAGAQWWTTSALESNIGLNAIAQFTFTLHNPLPQGLGTGQLYTNNIESPLQIRSGKLFHDPGPGWDLSPLQ